MAARYDQRTVVVSFADLKEALGITEEEDIEDVKASLLRTAFGSKTFTFGTVTIVLKKRRVTSG